MPTREEVMRAVARVRSLRAKYAESGEQSVAADEQRWAALREAQWDERTAGVVAADTQVADKNAASNEAFAELGRALVEMHTLARPVRQDNLHERNSGGTSGG